MANGTLKVGTITTSSGSGNISIGSGVTINVNRPVWYVKLSSDQNVASSTQVKVTWDTEVIDTDGAFASNKFTVPTGQDGKYFFYSNVMFQNLAASRIARLDFYKNGSQISEFRDVTAAANDISISGQIGVSLSAGDYIEVFAYQNDSGTEVAAGGSYDITNFGGYKIIE